MGIRPLLSFLDSVRGMSQVEILKTFLSVFVKDQIVSESGSIHVFDPDSELLHLFNHNDFLFVQGILQRDLNWEDKPFKPWSGFAGTAFARKRRVFSNDVRSHRRYDASKNSPIHTMVCEPILIHGYANPFGVVSFHNDSVDEKFNRKTLSLINLYVNTLALALVASPSRHSPYERPRVFVVHGHDSESLKNLKELLEACSLKPIVLKDQPKVGDELLQMLDNLIGSCTAGFVLLTPDDFGYPQGKPADVKARARENVIFESGYLASKFRRDRRVCYLIKDPVELPSDMKGLLCHKFQTIDTFQDGIKDVLRDWGLVPAVRDDGATQVS